MQTILIIEDEPFIRANIAQILGFHDYATLEAEDGMRGVQMAREHLPDLIVCDIMMPEMDGYEVLSTLRGDSITANIPFIFLTAVADRGNMRRGMELGADDYVTKPFEMKELVNAVASRLEKQALFAEQYEQKLTDLRMMLVTTLPHELRTPLTGILGYSDLIAQDAETMDRRQIAKMATAINNAGERLLRLVENYLLYAQVEIIGADPERIALMRKQITHNPQALIELVIAQYGEKRSADFTTDLENAALQISEENLERIMGELIDNALKFSDTGSRIAVKSRFEDDSMVISVRNSGRGMSASDIRNIGAYVQFERKLYEQQGSGLGLTIARRLVEICGGELTIDSIPNHETTVTVKLPLA
jgi:two-component system, sensor histidine kinase and response regulator